MPSNSTQSQIPFARVNHNKYMVTDNCAFIGKSKFTKIKYIITKFLPCDHFLGTSNWSGDYFIDTAGVSLVIPSADKIASSDTIRLQLQQIFQRDWDSDFSRPLVM